MKRENGGEQLPAALPRQLRRYVSGAMVNIPAKAENRAGQDLRLPALHLPA